MGQIEPKRDSPDEVDHKIALALVRSPKMTDAELAKKFGLCRKTINRRKNSNTVKKLVRDALSLPREEIKRLVSRSLSKLEEHLDSPNTKVSLAAAIHLTKLAAKTLEAEVHEDDELEFVYE